MISITPVRMTAFIVGIFIVSAQAYGHGGIYAKLLSLQVSEDISASGLRGDGDRYRKLSIPWRSECLPVSENVCAGAWLRGSHMDVKSDMGDQELFHWEAYGLSAGGDVTIKLSEYLSFRGGVGVGYSRIYNRSHIQDHTEWDNSALDWKHKNVRFVSPEMEGIITFGDFSLRPGISFLSISECSSGLGDIDARTGSYSLRMAYTFRNAFSLMGQEGHIVVGNNTGGFYGAGHRDDLGFSMVNETQILAAIPFARNGATTYIHTGPGLLLADNGAKGMSFTFSLKI